eukprot:5563604-Prymnesium_polylepis.1
MTDVRRRLERQRSIAAEHALALANEPCGIHIGTRERADTVRDVLTEASNNLEHSCPEALAATSAVLRLLHRQRRDMQYTDFDRLDQVLNAGLLAGQPEPASEGEAHGHAVADAVAAELAALVGARADVDEKRFGRAGRSTSVSPVALRSSTLDGFGSGNLTVGSPLVASGGNVWPYRTHRCYI